MVGFVSPSVEGEFPLRISNFAWDFGLCFLFPFIFYKSHIIPVYDTKNGQKDSGSLVLGRKIGKFYI